MESYNDLERSAACSPLECLDLNDKKMYSWILRDVKRLCMRYRTGKAVEIPIFSNSCDTFDGKLQLFPNGDTVNNKNNVVFSFKYRANRCVKIKFLLFIYDSYGEEIMKHEIVYVFNQETPIYESYIAMQRTVFLTYVALNDAIKIRIEKYFQHDSISKLGFHICKNFDQHPRGKLLSDLESMYNDNVLCDFKLKVGSSVFNVHSNILAVRSPVLKRMLEHDTLEKATGCLEILDMQENTAKQMINFIYTGKVNLASNEEAESLLIAADKYCLIDLKYLCSDYLKSNLTLTNVLDMLLSADLYNVLDLKKKALHFISKNFWNFGNPSKYKSILKNRPELLLEVLSKIVATKAQQQNIN